MAKKLKIAVVAPSFGDTGGPEVATNNLVNSFVDLGHDVTLFAPADFKTKAKLIPTLKQSLWNMKDFAQQTALTRRNYVIKSQLVVLKHQHKFDIIQIMLQRNAYIVGSLIEKPCVLTFHSKITSPEFEQIKDTGLYTVALSEWHKAGHKTTTAISNGINTKKIKPSFTKGEYLITAGRLVESKGIDTAIKIAQKTGKKLLIIGRRGISKHRRDYFNHKIKPHLCKNIVHFDEVPQKVLFEYIKNAEAFLYPIKPKNGKYIIVTPLVVMEALACGTPVIGAPIEPIPIPLKNKSIAVLTNDISTMIKAVKNIDQYDRKKCRKYAEKYFDASVMADKYIKLYQKILSNKKTKSNF